jgi:hypothetical protein
MIKAVWETARCTITKVPAKMGNRRSSDQKKITASDYVLTPSLLLLRVISS